MVSVLFVSSVSVIRLVAGVFILSLSPTHNVTRVCDWFENRVTSLPLSAFQNQHTHTCVPATAGWQTDTHAPKHGKPSQTTNKHPMNGLSQSDPSLAEFNETPAISVGNVGDASKSKTYIFPSNSKQWSFQGPNVPGSGQMDTLGLKKLLYEENLMGKDQWIPVRLSCLLCKIRFSRY